MRHLTLAIASIAALAVSAPAAASVVLTPTFGVTGSSSTSGTLGNIRSWTYSDGSGHSVSLNVSAFSISTSSTCTGTTSAALAATCISKSFLGDFSQGLGATSTGDGSLNSSGNYSGSSNSHTIDNDGRQDFIVLQFDRKVKLISATFTPFTIGSNSSLDTDATIGVGTGSLPTSLTTRGQFNSLFTTQYSSNSTKTGTTSAQLTETRLLDPANYVGKIWFIAASMETGAQRYHDNKKDAFKLKDVKVQTVGAVPEPASWAMMIAGFGFIGGALRRRKASVAFQAA
jgi:PEP-CTERM motif